MTILEGVIQRLFPESVAGQGHRIGVPIINGKGEHADKPVKALFSPLFESMQHDFRVCFRPQGMPAIGATPAAAP